MSESQAWDAVDAYFTDHLAPDDEVTAAALRDSEAAELPPVNVTANQGKLLQLARRDPGGPDGPGDRHARRLQHDLARPRAPGRR